jgi:3-deoxy-7-phosphoheptulonate synthase
VETLISGTRRSIQRIMRARMTACWSSSALLHPRSRRRTGLRPPPGRGARAVQGPLEVVMRVYFEKPRTTVGWKGLINDPYLDGATASTKACALRASC